MAQPLPRRYIAFDVETPNRNSDRMSAIGLTVVEDEAVLQSYYTLVNPEVPFDPFHIRLTGITPAMAAEAPTFSELWPSLAPLLGSGVLAAHNAPFDLAVLGRCLRAYGIRWRAAVPYLCTCQMSRRLLPQLPDHRLDTLCRYCGISLNHHHAGSDSRACGELLARHLQAGASPLPFLRTYDLYELRTRKARP